MGVKVYPRFALITTEREDALTERSDACGKEWKREMLCEIKDYFQRVEPGEWFHRESVPNAGRFAIRLGESRSGSRNGFRRARGFIRKATRGFSSC